jgi:hypothetical protein
MLRGVWQEEQLHSPEHKVLNPSISDSASSVLCLSQSCSSKDPATFCKLKLFPTIRPKNIPGHQGGALEVEVAECLDIARAIGKVQSQRSGFRYV